MTKTLEFRWTVSRGRDTYGYNICSLYVNGTKVSACNGGGYDMKGTALGNYIASAYRDRLNALSLDKGFYGLTYHDPSYNPGKAVLETGETVEQAEAEGRSLGLARYQAAFAASSKTPTERHTIPSIDGACGLSSVEAIMKAIGLTLEYVPTRSKTRQLIYILHDEVED